MVLTRSRKRWLGNWGWTPGSGWKDGKRAFKGLIALSNQKISKKQGVSSSKRAPKRLSWIVRCTTTHMSKSFSSLALLGYIVYSPKSLGFWLVCVAEEANSTLFLWHWKALFWLIKTTAAFMDNRDFCDGSVTVPGHIIHPSRRLSVQVFLNWSCCLFKSEVPWGAVPVMKQ